MADPKQVQRTQLQASGNVLFSPLRWQVQHDLARYNLVQEARRSQHVVYPDSLQSPSHGIITQAARIEPSQLRPA